jgi:hypothetical protein
MLDDLRHSAAQSYEEEVTHGKKPPRKRRPFLGMTAPQRFIIALVILVMTCLLGVLFLVVSGKIVF